jgi:hypothetical protein
MTRSASKKKKEPMKDRLHSVLVAKRKLRHLTGSPDLLEEDTDKAGTFVLIDGTRARSLRKGKVEIVTHVDHEALHIVVEDVEYVPGFKRNWLSYVSLEKKGVRLEYESGERYDASKIGKKLAEVKSEGNALVVRGELSGALANAVLVHNVVDEQEHVSEAVHEDTLYNRHKRFDHQSYDAIEALAAKPSSGIKLIDRERPNIMTCGEGKQTKNRQSEKERGNN